MKKLQWYHDALAGAPAGLKVAPLCKELVDGSVVGGIGGRAGCFSAASFPLPRHGIVSHAVSLYKETPETVLASLRAQDRRVSVNSGNSGGLRHRPGWAIEAYALAQRYLTGKAVQNPDGDWL